MTNSFSYRGGAYCAESVPLEKIAAELGTPFYCYSSAQLLRNFRAFTEPFAGIDARYYYAVKANPNLAVIRMLGACGAGADVTSVGELERALQAGIEPGQIVFSGVGKRRDEITAALLARIFQINVESVPELEAISRIAAELGCEAPIALRVNPDIDANTHPKTATGHEESKFGIERERLDEAIGLATRLPGLSFKGLMVHIGSHLQDLEPFRRAFGRMADLVRHYREQGIAIDRLDLGGGVGIAYDGEKAPDFQAYARIVKDTVQDLGCTLMFEPGRWLVGNAGVLVSRVTYVKRARTKRHIILDAGMNDLLRPALYGARHTILPLREAAETAALAFAADVVGPVCESSDRFGADYTFRDILPNDLVAILQAGAYGAAMSSCYNGRALVPEVLVTGSDYAVVRRRIAVAEQIAWESLPSWLCAVPKTQ